MSVKKAFLLNYYNESENKISLKGRVLIDLKINDTLLYFIDCHTPIKYPILNIIAYRREFDIINSGMTCEIITKGHLCDFKEDSIFYIEVNN